MSDIIQSRHCAKATGSISVFHFEYYRSKTVNKSPLPRSQLCTSSQQVFALFRSVHSPEYEYTTVLIKSYVSCIFSKVNHRECLGLTTLVDPRFYKYYTCFSLIFIYILISHQCGCYSAAYIPKFIHKYVCSHAKESNMSNILEIKAHLVQKTCSL